MDYVLEHLRPQMEGYQLLFGITQETSNKNLLRTGLISLLEVMVQLNLLKQILLGNSQAPLKQIFDTYTTEGRSAGDPLYLLQVHWFGHGKKSL